MATTRSRTRTRTGGNTIQLQKALEISRKRRNQVRLDKIRRETLENNLDKIRQERLNKLPLKHKHKTGKRKKRTGKRKMGTRMINPMSVESPMSEFTESQLTASPMMNVGDLRDKNYEPKLRSSERRSLEQFDLHQPKNDM
jgi:hypothetical protein